MDKHRKNLKNQQEIGFLLINLAEELFQQLRNTENFPTEIKTVMDEWLKEKKELDDRISSYSAQDEVNNIVHESPSSSTAVEDSKESENISIDSSSSGKNSWDSDSKKNV